MILFSSLNFEQTAKIIKLKSLKELRCAFEDARCIDLLTDLTELEVLYIMLDSGGTFGKECLNILRSCRKRPLLHINANLSTDFLGKALQVLEKVRNVYKQKPLLLYFIIVTIKSLKCLAYFSADLIYGLANKRAMLST